MRRKRLHQVTSKRIDKGQKIDRQLLFLTLFLTVIGITAVADASAPQAQAHFGDSFFFVRQQIVWGVLGVIGMFVTSRIHFSFWHKLSVPLFLASVGMLLIVLIPGVGIKVLGARRWINLGFFSYQPAEFVKLILAIYFARLAESGKNLKAYVIILAAIAGLIMLQPDLGTTLIVTGIGMIQIFASGASLVHLAGIVIGGAVSALILILSSDYRRDRLLTYFGAGNDPSGTSYHINQILIALGSGGLLGVGIGQSRQKYLFLPESATDSVFAVIAEEVGFLGSSVIIALFLIFIYKGLTIAQRAPDTFSRLLAVGITSWIGIQAALNISSMVALTPLTGVPMPFFSYGGTSLTMILVGIGILLNISKYAKIEPKS